MSEGMEIDSLINNIIDDIIGDIIGEVTVVLCDELRDILNRKREVWVRQWISLRDESGASDGVLRELMEGDREEFRKVLRMSVEKFNELLQLCSPLISKQNTTMRESIPPKTKLQLALLYLATGDSFRSLSMMFRVPICTISIILPEVLQAIVTVLSQYITVPNQSEQWKEIQRNFEVQWNFPKCCGAIDGKHIEIKKPPHSVSDFYNYKGKYSVVLMALVDYDYKFLYIDVGTNGRANDGSIFKLSTLHLAMAKNLLNFPSDFVIVAHDAFPLTKHVLKPFTRRGLTLEERIFNYRLSRARRVTENAFGILASRFRVFLKPIEVQLPTVDLIVQAACSIHNWLRTTSATTYCPTGFVDYEDINSGVVHPGSWRSEMTELQSITQPRGGNKNSKEGTDRRVEFMNFFVGKGSVPWQIRAIGIDE